MSSCEANNVENVKICRVRINLHATVTLKGEILVIKIILETSTTMFNNAVILCQSKAAIQVVLNQKHLFNKGMLKNDLSTSKYSKTSL